MPYGASGRCTVSALPLDQTHRLRRLEGERQRHGLRARPQGSHVDALQTGSISH
jgi:hypothetical protein